MAAARATLEHVLTDDAFGKMIRLAERFEAGVSEAIERHEVDWNVVRLGCRVEDHFGAEPARTGGEAYAAFDSQLDSFMHLFTLNRGILLTPFHMMALMCPATTEAQVDRHTTVFDEALEALGGP